MPPQAYYADRIGPHRARTPEGFLLAMGVPISRTGYQTYKARELQPSGIPDIDRLSPDASVQIYRDGEDVFEPAAMASFEGKSVTQTHPPGGYLTPDNDRQYARGHAQNVRGPEILPDGESALIADLLIKDSQTIQYVDDRVMDEISCGYTYRLEPYQDGWRMRNIRGNHVAIVPSGRAGDHVRILDAKPEERSNKVIEELKALGSFFKDFGLGVRPIGDAESETVAKQKEKDEEALKLKQRTMDAEAEEKQRAEDAKKMVDAVSAAVTTALDAKLPKMVKDAMEEMGKKAADAEKCSCDEDDKEDWDAEEGHTAGAFGAHHADDCPMFKAKDRKAKDADLIPVATLPEADRPKNPLHQTVDAAALVEDLRRLRPHIADSGDPKLQEAFNRAMLAAKGKKRVADDDYAVLLKAASTTGDDAEIARQRLNTGQPVAGDSNAPGSYGEMMKKYHRTDPATWGKTQ